MTFEDYIALLVEELMREIRIYFEFLEEVNHATEEGDVREAHKRSLQDA